MFKKFLIYTLAPGFALNANALEEVLTTHPLLPVNQASMQSRGWVPPAPGAALVYSHGKQLLIALGIEQRMLPAKVITAELEKRLALLEKEQGFAPGRKQRRDLKDVVIDELRPKAFIERKTVRAWLDFEAGRIIVDASSPSMAESLLITLRADLGELPCYPVDTVREPGPQFTAWVRGKSLPGYFALGDSCEIVADNEVRSTVKYSRHALDNEAPLRAQLEGGKKITSLALEWRERILFTVTERLGVKGVTFLSTKEEKDEHAEGDAFDADFLLFTGEIGLLVDELLIACGGVRVLA